MEGLSSTNNTQFRTTFCIISIIRVLVGLGQLPRVQAYGVYLGGLCTGQIFTQGITLAKKGHSAAWVPSNVPVTAASTGETARPRAVGTVIRAKLKQRRAGQDT